MLVKSAIKLMRRMFCTTEVIETDRTKISKFEIKNFNDNVRLTIKAGKGGNGAIAFYTDKRVRRGAPDGGDGGTGGNIQIQAHQAMHDLSHLRLKNIVGNDGENGGPRGKGGKNGGKTLMRVPCGTLVYEILKEEEVEKKKFIIDLSENKKVFVLAKGGQKGKGNKQNLRLKESQRFGTDGESKIIYLQMKMLADIGLVGFPNVGKSTFLAASTRALPKIANYQFTTLKPSVGYVKFVDDYRMTIADIPGIIEDAHLNRGLGLQFLRHIERTKVLVFMLDITQADPLEHYRLLERELAEYHHNFFKDKKRIVVFNKMDCLDHALEKYNVFSSRLACKTFLVSAKEGANVGQALLQLRRIKELLTIEEQQNKQQQKINHMDQQLHKKQ